MELLVISKLPYLVKHVLRMVWLKILTEQGVFLMNTGQKFMLSENGLITTIGCSLDSKINYALEGSIFVAGAAIQWLRDSLGIINNASDTEKIADSIKKLNDIYVVPAFAGLGAPYWDMYSRGAIFGLTRDTDRDQIIKATLESLVYQTKDIIDVMEKDSWHKFKFLKSRRRCMYE